MSRYCSGDRDAVKADPEPRGAISKGFHLYIGHGGAITMNGLAQAIGLLIGKRNGPGRHCSMSTPTMSSVRVHDHDVLQAKRPGTPAMSRRPSHIPRATARSRPQ